MTFKNLGRLVLLTSLTGTGLAQGTPTEAQIRDRFVNDARREAIRSVAPAASFKGADTAKLKKSIDRFSTATDDYRTALGSKASLEQPLKNLEKALVDLEKYFRTPKTPKVNKAAYARLSPGDFAAETLKSADRIKADLPALLKTAEDPLLLIDHEVSQFLMDLHHEALQLKYLASKSRPTKAK
jgi:hypothetical protein